MFIRLLKWLAGKIIDKIGEIIASIIVMGVAAAFPDKSLFISLHFSKSDIQLGMSIGLFIAVWILVAILFVTFEPVKRICGLFTKGPSEAPWVHYTKMEYKGFLIRWNYTNHTISVLCPKCECEVTRQSGPTGNTYCPLCKTYFAENISKEDYNNIIKIIIRNIEKGEYPKGGEADRPGG
jgi:hypothetical protein